MAVAFNDVDLCMRIRRQGYWIVWTPFAELTHYESRTRGPEDTPEKLWTGWNRRQTASSEPGAKNCREGDPFYSPHLTLSCEDFALRV